MGWYAKHVLPRIIHFTCSTRPNMRQREKLVPMARGRVLEVGIGSGLNLPYYDAARVAGVWGLDPSPELAQMAGPALAEVTFPVSFIEAFAEEMPLESDTFDTVLLTYTLCSIPDVGAALGEMARVLKPGGQLLFCEHGSAPDPDVRRWQDRMDPLWHRLGGGCHLNRDIPGMISSGGFEISGLESMYIPGWRPASFNYWGRARPR